MPFTTLVKNKHLKVIAEFLSSTSNIPFLFYKQHKSKRKISRIKRKLKSKGVVYTNKALFNEANKNLLFIHIPKAAGMSVVKALYNQNRSHHASATDYKKEDEIKFSQAFSFAITRNPYTRLYSAYNYLKSGGMNNIDRAWWELYLAKYDSFEDFIIGGGLDNAIQNNAEHFIPQHKFIFDEKGNLIVDYLGNIENIQEVEEVLTQKIQKEIIFSHRNAIHNSAFDLNNIYSNKMIEVVNHCYKKDFLLLDYDVR